MVSELDLYLYTLDMREKEEESNTLIHTSKWYQSKKISLFFVAEKKEIISPCLQGVKDNHSIQKIGETREVRGRQAQNTEMER